MPHINRSYKCHLILSLAEKKKKQLNPTNVHDTEKLYWNQEQFKINKIIYCMKTHFKLL